MDRLYLWVSSTLLGSVEHLQGRLSQSLSLVQESHLLLVVPQLGRHAHRGLDEWLKVTSQLGHLQRTVKKVKRDFYMTKRQRFPCTRLFDTSPYV